MMIAAVFFLSFCQNFIATSEIQCISRDKAMIAAMWAFLNSSVYFLVLVFVILDLHRWNLFVPYVGGDVLATFLAVRRRK